MVHPDETLDPVPFLTPDQVSDGVTQTYVPSDIAPQIGELCLRIAADGVSVEEVPYDPVAWGDGYPVPDPTPTPTPTPVPTPTPTPEPFDVDVAETSLTPTWDGVNDFANIKVTVAPSRSWELHLVDEFGATLLKSGIGEDSFIWYGTVNGTFVPSSTYQVVLTSTSGDPREDQDSLDYAKPIGSTFQLPANGSLSPGVKMNDFEEDVYAVIQHPSDVSNYIWPFFDEGTVSGRDGGLLTHYLKHYTDFFGNITEQQVKNPGYLRQYFRMACDQVKYSHPQADTNDEYDHCISSSGKQSSMRKVGSRYFAVLHSDNNIGTFFLPFEPTTYWQNEISNGCY